MTQTPTTNMTHSYTQQELLAFAEAGDRLTLSVEDAIWVWLPEADVWFQKEGAMEGLSADPAEMTEHIREQQGEGYVLRVNCRGTLDLVDPRTE